MHTNYNPTAYYLPNSKLHTMTSALLPYIELKLHHLLLEKTFKKIVVVGRYDRDHSMISKNEKQGKIENWQRPTATVKGSTLYIECFPGKSYVQHYASLIATYLAITGQDPSIVSYEQPTRKEFLQAIDQLGLESVPVSDWLILGANLTEIGQDGPWQEHKHLTFSRQKLGNASVTYLLCHVSYWGEILEEIVRQLILDGHQRLIFTAKLGGINPKLAPNQSLATGNTTMVNNRVWSWDNIFAESKHPSLHFGAHLNSTVIMQENKEWLKYVQMYDFVDSEVGCFIAGCENAKVRSYLHIVSNNLSKQHRENLSNERTAAVLKKRQQMTQVIRQLISEAIDRTPL